MSKETSPSQATTVGGPVLAAFATLRIFGPTLNPTEITRMMGRPPSSSYRTGDQISPRVTTARKNGMWRLDSLLPRTETLSAHVIRLLAQLPNDRIIWSTIHQEFTADVYCSVDVRLPNSGMELTSSAIEALAARALSIQFDLYALSDEKHEE